ncbi:MAG: 30S ribosomal protein S2, partial [Nitrospira sp.]|nr:30S ribosomal protein S2 [Nitrospira sp.]
MGVVAIRELLEAGVHFGHQTNRWNPKMKKFLFGERNGIYIIDLQQTLTRMEQAYAFVRDTVAAGDSILFVGTKRQAAEILEEEAKRANMFFVNQRWLGGMLTNFQTIRRSIDKMKKMETILLNPSAHGLKKKEILLMQKDIA